MNMYKVVEDGFSYVLVVPDEGDAEKKRVSGVGLGGVGVGRFPEKELT